MGPDDKKIESGIEAGSGVDNEKKVIPINRPKRFSLEGLRNFFQPKKNTCILKKEEDRANEIRSNLGLPEKISEDGGSEEEYILGQGGGFRDAKQEDVHKEGITIRDPQEYYKDLKEMGSSSRAAWLDRSEIFRHTEDYTVFEQEMKRILSENPEKKIKMLDVGIGNLEEPLSFVSIVNEVREKSHSLEDSFDLRMVDIRGKEDILFKKSLGKTFLDGRAKIGEAFVSESRKTQLQKVALDPPVGKKHLFCLSPESGEYEFFPEVAEYIKKIFDDSSKTFLAMPIENYLENLPEDEKFDFIVFNNVAQHLGGKEYKNPFRETGLEREGYDRFYQVIEALLKRLNKNGIIFFHVPSDILDKKSRGGTSLIFNQSSFFKNNFQELRSAIYRRIT